MWCLQKTSEQSLHIKISFLLIVFEQDPHFPGNPKIEFSRLIIYHIKQLMEIMKLKNLKFLIVFNIFNRLLCLLIQELENL